MPTKKEICGPMPSQSVRIPAALLKEFAQDFRVIVRGPGTIGFQADIARLVQMGPEAQKQVQAGFDVILVPKSAVR